MTVTTTASERMKQAWVDHRANMLAGSAKTATKNRGTKQNYEWRQKRSIALKNYFKSHPEACERRRDLGYRLAASPYHYKDHKGGSYIRTPEIRKKISDGLKRAHQQKPELLVKAREYLCKAQYVLRHSHRSQPELIMEALLDKLDIAAVSDFSFSGNRFILDFAVPAQHIAILVDGCYWHCCPIHHPFAKTVEQQGNLKRDREREKALKRAGWHTLHFWEHQLKEESSLDKVRQEVARLCVSC